MENSNSMALSAGLLEEPVISQASGKLSGTKSIGGNGSPTTDPKPTGSLYRVVWRWHFYAGVLVTPILLTLSITGGLYIFKSEIEDFARSGMVFVVPEEKQIGYQAQVDAAVAAHPGHVAASVTFFPEPNRATTVTLRKPEPQRPAAEGASPARGRGRGRGPSVQAYVNPHTGAVTGSIPGETSLGSFFAITLRIHRNLFAGTTGRVITELATSWTIVLLVTGTYLWWPKKSSKTAGVWWPRLDAKRYTVLRDLHSVAGMYLFPVALTIAITGMFYTLAVGKVIHDVAHYAMEDPEEAPAAAGRGSRAEGAKSPDDSRPAEPVSALSAIPGISLDEAVTLVRGEYPDRRVFATLQSRGGDNSKLQMGAGNDFNNTYGRFVSTQFTIDRQAGAVLSRKHLSEGGHFWHGWTYPLHVGSVMGPASKVLWLLACIVLAALPVTGLWMWWQRRPGGRSGLPRRPAIRLPLWLIGTIGALSVVLPIMGASLLLILLGETAYRLIRSRIA